METEPKSLQEAITLPIPAPLEAFDLEARAEAYLASAIAKTRVDYYRHNTPLAYRDEFDPEHPSIAKHGNAEAIKTVLGWVKGERGLLLSGKQGRGKTRAAFALCKRLLCEQSVDVGIWQASAFFAAMGECVRFGSDEAEGWVKRMAARPVFFLDDFGQQAVLSAREDWAKAWFFRFLDIRIGAKLPLIMTTNQTAEQISGQDYDVKGDPLVRRLIELAQPVKFN